MKDENGMIEADALEQKLLSMGWRCEWCGSTEHIRSILDQGYISCCPDRELAPPSTCPHLKKRSYDNG